MKARPKDLVLLPLTQSEGLWGFIDHRGHWLIEAQFAEAAHFSCGFAVCKQSEEIYFIDAKGVRAFQQQFIDCQGFWDGSAVVCVLDSQNRRLWGQIDGHGTYNLKPKFDFLAPLFEDRQRFCQDGKWGYLDRQGNEVIAPQYDWAGDFVDGIARVQKVAATLETFFIGKENRRISPQNFENAEDFSAGYAAVYQDGLWGLIDKEAKLVVPYRFREVGDFSEGVFPVSESEDNWRYVDQKGNPSQLGEFELAHSFVEGFARFKHKTKWGMIDAQGVVKIPAVFEVIEDFCNNWAIFRKAGRVGYLSQAGIELYGK